MKLVSMTLQNFRCYRDEFLITFDTFTTIIGKNDAGKSAILEALDVFFNGLKKIDQGDASVGGDPKNVRISCEFDDLPSQIIIDASAPTSLQQEYLLSSTGTLIIEKTYNLSGPPKLTSVQAVAAHPTLSKYSDLLILKRAELIKRAGELQVNLDGVNKSVNSEIRRAIWASAADLDCKLTKIDLSQDGGKAVWEELERYFPTYWLFKSDRPSTDQDAEAQDPLNMAISDAMKSLELEFQSIIGAVKEKVEKVAELTVAKIAEMDSSVAASLSPVIKVKKWDSLFSASITGEDGIPLNKRGSGIRRLVLLNFFRAQVEVKTDSDISSVIYAVEEPETGQHPNNQRLLMSTLRQLTTDTSRQVIVTSHSPMLARTVPDRQIRFIDGNSQRRTVQVGGATVNDGIASALGVLPDNAVKVFVGVEGPHDISFLQSISSILSIVDDGIESLRKLEVEGVLIFIPLGGSTLFQWTSRLQPLQRPEFHLCDRDEAPPKAAKYQAYVNAINERPNCVAKVTSKRELENFIHPAAIYEAYRANNVEISVPASFDDFDDVPLRVAMAVALAGSGTEWDSLTEENKKRKVSAAKKILNNQAVALMTPERLGEVDPTGEVLSWLRHITGIARA